MGDAHYSDVLHIGNRACAYALGNPEAKILYLEWLHLMLTA